MGLECEHDIKIKVTFGVLQNTNIARLLETVPRMPATRAYTPILKYFESEPELESVLSSLWMNASDWKSSLCCSHNITYMYWIKLCLLCKQTCIRKGQAHEFRFWTLIYVLWTSFMMGRWLRVTNWTTLYHFLGSQNNNVLLEHGGLSHVLPLTVHQDLFWHGTWDSGVILIRF